MPWDINRIGQKVRCVQDPALWPNVCSELIRWPLLDGVYTVTGFAEIEDQPGIHLAELGGVTCRCFGLNNAPWPMECFRPLDQRETDISALKKILDQTPQPVGRDVVVHEV